MTSEFLTLLGLGAVMGGFINGLAGFGTAMFALGFWLQIMPPLQAVSTVVVVSTVTGLQGIWLVRHSITAQPRRLARFVVPSLFGIPMGVAVLSVLDAGTLKITIALFLILYGGFFSLRSTLPKLQRPTPVIDGIVGFLGGVSGGAASLSGAFPTMWCALRPWSKSETRAVLQPYNAIVLGLAMMMFAFKGLYTWDSVRLILIALPVTMLSAQIGIMVFKRLTDDQFRRLIIVMMFVSGVVLLGRELL